MVPRLLAPPSRPFYRRYLVHTTSFVKIVITFLKPFISKKFGKKIHFCKRLVQLEERIEVSKLGVPTSVEKYDSELKEDKKDRSSSKSGKDSKGGSRNVFGALLSTMEAVTDDGVPTLIEDCIEYITSSGKITTEGIFRRSVGLGTVNELKAKYNKGESVSLEAWNDVQLAAVLMKSFFRELREPLLTFKLYDEFVALALLDDPEIKLTRFQDAIGKLPDRNRVVLRRLISFLVTVTEHEEKNRMSTNNIAIVFGPNLLWSEDAVASFGDTGKINTITRFMLEEKRLWD